MVSKASFNTCNSGLVFRVSDQVKRESAIPITTTFIAMSIDPRVEDLDLMLVTKTILPRIVKDTDGYG